MTTVRLTKVRIGPGYAQSAGTILPLDDDEAKSLIARGRAELFEQPMIETAAVQPAETRKRSPRPRKKRGNHEQR